MVQSFSAPTRAQRPRSADSALSDPARLALLRASGLLDGAENIVLDRLARLVTRLLHVPVSLVSLVDDQGQHFPGLSGLGGWAGAARGTPLTHSLCRRVVASDAPLVLTNLDDDADTAVHPARVDLGVVAYAGVPLRSADGITLGALCAIDTAAVLWTAEQIEILEDLASAAVAEIELRATTTALAASHEKLRAQALQDPLTGLLNRRGFSDAARQHLAACKRSQIPFLLCALDLNDFKAINDTFGHDAGDAALIEMAALLKRTFRDADIICRAGGDEFVVLVTATTASEGSTMQARLESALACRNAALPRELPLSSSIGIAAWTPDSESSFSDLLRHADAAMYEHKRLGKSLRQSPARRSA
jgi:diguanylate cyclase (GGDEF)-like protein